MVRAEPMLHVEVAHGKAPRQVECVAIDLPVGSTVGDALRTCGLSLQGMLIGVWGRRCDPSQPLRDGDRVELYRALTVDPKEARRLRYKAQGRLKAKRPAKAER